MKCPPQILVGSVAHKFTLDTKRSLRLYRVVLICTNVFQIDLAPLKVVMDILRTKLEPFYESQPLTTQFDFFLIKVAMVAYVSSNNSKK